MIKYVMILAMVGTAWAVTSNVAFTSYTDMMNSEPTELANVVVKNTDPTETTRDCIFIREWKARYNFTQSDKHEYIYYYVWQCLDVSLKLLRSNVTFNYDGDDNNMHELPEGCVPPSPEVTPPNPCENGFKLGEDIIKNVSTMVTKKLVDHPQDNEFPEEVLENVDPNELDEVLKNLPDLEEQLEKLVEENHATNPENRPADETKPNPDGTVTEVYKFPNGDVAEKTPTDDKTTTVLTKPDGTTVTQVDKPNEPSVVEKRDPEGKLVERKIIEPNPEDPTEEVVRTFNPPDTQTPTEITRSRQPPGTPVDVDIPADVEEQFDNAAQGFAASLEKYVEESVKCFSEQVINVQESYLTFVCAETGHDSIRAALEERFAGQMMCEKIDCDQIQQELMTQMAEHAISGDEGPGPKVTRKLPESA